MQAPGQISVTVKLHGHLAWYLAGRQEELTVQVSAGTTLDDLVRQLGVPGPEVWLVARNGVHVKGGETLAEGDRVELIPVVAGG